MTWSGKKVLVTGAGGFIGSHLTEALVTAGAQVRAMVHYNSAGRRGWLDQSPLKNDMEIVAGDITDGGSVSAAMQGRDVVFHLAALIAIPYSYSAPLSYVQTNIVGTLNVLEAARRLGTSRVIQTSTSEVYGTAQFVPISETHPLQGQSPYSASKIGGQAGGIVFPFLRPAGGHGSALQYVWPEAVGKSRAADNHHAVSRRENRPPGQPHANPRSEFRLRHGSWIHGLCGAPDAVSRTLNIGSGREISVGDLAQLTASLIGADVRIECEDQRLRPPGSEVERLLADNRLAAEVVGWKPAVSLETGLQRTIDWFRENAGSYRADVYNV